MYGATRALLSRFKAPGPLFQCGVAALLLLLVVVDNFQYAEADLNSEFVKGKSEFLGLAPRFGRSVEFLFMMFVGNL